MKKEFEVNFEKEIFMISFINRQNEFCKSIAEMIIKDIRDLELETNISINDSITLKKGKYILISGNINQELSVVINGMYCTKSMFTINLQRKE